MASTTQPVETPTSPPMAPTSELVHRIEHLEAELAQLRDTQPSTKNVTLLVFSGELDKILAGLIIATTAASMGSNVTLFFTFWGINALKEKRVLQGKNVMEKMIDVMTPKGAEGMAVSQMNMLGAGAAMLKLMMKEKNVVSAHELLELAKEAGVKLVACSMTMEVMGLKKEELMDGIEVAGAATYLEDASRSSVTLFI